MIHNVADLLGLLMSTYFGSLVANKGKGSAGGPGYLSVSERSDH